ncbi:DUF6193 family natural product biosynthesis protein [Streptomyces sp. LN500]|uniref:DUF6193 family natural product biosynthesis protein n=1 Tax=Streptomyces sp. LN500 TaxID=3112978 RepID=UPI00371DCB91
MKSSEAAYANPLLRGLFPLISHGSLQFSRCTHAPWSYDVPSLHPQLGGGWRALPAHKGRDIPDRCTRQVSPGFRSRISTDRGTCGSNWFPVGVIFLLCAHEGRASR